MAKRLRDRVLWLKREIEVFRENTTIEEFCDALKRLIHVLGVQRAIMCCDDDDVVKRDCASLKNIEQILDALRGRIRKLQDERLKIPSEVPFTEAHNTWVFNKPATLVVIPVGDLSQHVLLNVCYMLQNGLVLYDDINKCAIPGIEQFKDIVDVENVWPITFVEQ